MLVFWLLMNDWIAFKKSSQFRSILSLLQKERTWERSVRKSGREKFYVDHLNLRNVYKPSHTTEIKRIHFFTLTHKFKLILIKPFSMPIHLNSFFIPSLLSCRREWWMSKVFFGNIFTCAANNYTKSNQGCN